MTAPPPDARHREGLLRVVLPVVLLLVVGAAAFFALGGGLPGASTDGTGRGEDDGEPWFTEVSEAAGLDFIQVSGADGQYLFPETTCGGVAWFDYDRDGHLDLYLVQAGHLGPEIPATYPNRLFRNLGDGTFADVTEAAGVGDPGYGHGCA
ncbi:MAG: FG-GAP repeat domain-containing protein, partial [Planctomycetota bacterium]